MTRSEARAEFADGSQLRFDGLSTVMDEFHRDIAALFQVPERVLLGTYGPLTATAAMDTEWWDLWAGRQQDEWSKHTTKAMDYVATYIERQPVRARLYAQRRAKPRRHRGAPGMQ